MVQEQDKSFKYLANEQVEAFLKIMPLEIDFDSSKFEVKTKEQLGIKATLYRPDYIVEFNDLIVMIEFQGSKVYVKDKKRFKAYVSVFDLQQNSENNEMVFFVVSTTENSKIVQYQTSKNDIFKFDIVGLKEFDEKEIINNIKDKIRVNDTITVEDSVKLALTPVMTSRNNALNQINETVELISQAKFEDEKSRENAYGVTLLFANMVLEDDDSLIDKVRRDYMMKFDIVNDFGDERYNEGKSDGISVGESAGIAHERVNVACKMLASGKYSLDEISEISGLPLDDIIELKNQE